MEAHVFEILPDTDLHKRYGSYGTYPKVSTREAAPEPEAEADADLAALEDLVFAIKVSSYRNEIPSPGLNVLTQDQAKRADYGNYGNYGNYGK